jgi:hypothetical protein
MKDANLFKTLCDAADPIATGFTPVDTADAATVCSNNGRMTWNDAEVWIARLNAQNYRGHNDWRQPLTPQPDASCETQAMVAGFPDRCQPWRANARAGSPQKAFRHAVQSFEGVLRSQHRVYDGRGEVARTQDVWGAEGISGRVKFLLLAWAGMPKTSFRKNSDSPPRIGFQLPRQ